MTLSCAACGRTHAAVDRFCANCGTPIEQALRAEQSLGELVQRRLSDGERKRVTVLFADLQGSTVSSVGLAPLQIMAKLVERYDGVVCRRLGDGIFALFGAPVAHEDHAVRACFAALGMQRELRAVGLGEMIRVGLHSGDVLYRTVSPDQAPEVDAVGLAVQVAARMEQIAPAGSVYLTEATQALTQGLIETRPIGPHEIKGAPAPVEVYEATHASPFRSRWRPSGQERAPFVGREAERSALAEAVAALEAGQGSAVGLSAEAGLGKSRLVRRMVGEGSESNTSRVVHAGATAFGGDIAYYTLVSALRDLFGISEDDVAAHAAETVTTVLAGIDPALAGEAAVLSSLISPASATPEWLVMNPGHKRAAVVESCVRLARTLARQAPTVFVFEDMHWVDRDSEEVLRAIVELTRQERLLVILTHRPEYDDAWLAASGNRRLRMSPLDDDDVRRSLRKWFVEGPETDLLIERLVARTGGNPLFVEECLRALAQRGALTVVSQQAWSVRRRFACREAPETIELPPSVQDVIASRIDRRSADCAALLHTLSTVTRRIPHWLVQRVSGLPADETDAALGDALAAGLLVTASLSPDIEYSFGHAVLREVAHDALTRARRVELHRRLFAAIGEQYAGRPEEQAEWRAHHAAEGELWEEAAMHQGNAAERALARGSYGEAIAGLRTALTYFDRSIGTVPATERAIDHLLRLRRTLSTMGAHASETTALIDRAEELARRIDDKLRLGWVWNELSGELWTLGANREAAATARRSIQIAREAGDIRLQASALQRLGAALHGLGDRVEAADVLSECFELLSGDLRLERIASVYATSVLAGGLLVTALGSLGRYDEAEQRLAEVLKIAAETRDVTTIASAEIARCTLAIERGEVAAAMPLLEGLFAAAQAAGAVQLLQFLRVQLGRAKLLAGDSARAVELLDPAAEPEHLRGSFLYRLEATSYAEALAMEGALDKAQAQLDEVAPDVVRRGEKGNLAIWWTVRAKIALAKGLHENAERAYRRALDQGRALSLHRFCQACEAAIAEIAAGKVRAPQ